jgi:hypothetical protein
MQRVEDGEIALAGNAEALGDTQGNEALDKKATAIADHASASSWIRMTFRHPDPTLCWSMVFSENRSPLFGIML